MPNRPKERPSKSEVVLFLIFIALPQEIVSRIFGDVGEYMICEDGIVQTVNHSFLADSGAKGIGNKVQGYIANDMR